VECRPLLVEYKTLLVECGALLVKYRSLYSGVQLSFKGIWGFCGEMWGSLEEYRALLWKDASCTRASFTEYARGSAQYWPLLVECRALLVKYRAPVVEYGSLLVEYRAFFWKDTLYATAQPG